jgi:molybdopterin-synthase adenylyltransferase
MTGTGRYEAFFGVQAAALGDKAQGRVREACVAVVGGGGVGSSATLTLAAAGVGKLITIDPQVVTADNFNRLPYVTRADLGRPKVQVLRRLLRNRPHLTIEAIQARAEDVDGKTALAKADLILSASNTTASRIAATEYALSNDRLHIGAGVADARDSLSGAITAWNPNRRDLACHACFMAHAKESVGDVLVGSITAMAGLLAAHVAVLLLAKGTSSSSMDANLFVFDMGNYSMESVRVGRRPDCQVCGSSVVRQPVGNTLGDNR